MFTKEQLRQKAWLSLRDAKALRSNKSWDYATYLCGYAIELILKARIVVDHNLAGFPETAIEFRAAKAAGLDLKIHDFEALLNMTTLLRHVKSVCLSEWSTCLQWSPDTRYQPMGTATELSANELIRVATAIIKRIAEEPGLEAYDPAQFANVANPYVKLVIAERELSEEHGEFALFSVCHRRGSYPYSSDVVVAAPWINADSRAGVSHVVAAINKTLTGEEIKSVSGVIAVHHQSPALLEMSRFINVPGGGAVEMVNCKLGTVDVESAMFMVLKRV